MKVLSRDVYGGGEVLRICDAPVPDPGPSEIRVSVRAVSLNASDHEFLTGHPAYARVIGGLRRPRKKLRVLGSDIAGVVDAVGADVTEFAPGQRVFGDIFDHWGGLAEAAIAPADRLLSLPDGVGFSDAAAVPQAAAIALQALRHRRATGPGERVLINGAGGGAGSFAVQFAKRAGAHVTAVDSDAKLATLQVLGADDVIDYRTTDFTTTGATYDRIIDLVATRGIAAVRRVLAPNGVYMMVGGTVPVLLNCAIVGGLRSLVSDRKTGVLALKQSRDDLRTAIDGINSGEIRAVIDRELPLAAGGDGFAALGRGEVIGKLVLHP